MDFFHISENGQYHTYQCQYANLTYTIVYDFESDHIMRIHPHLLGGVDVIAEQFKKHIGKNTLS